MNFKKLVETFNKYFLGHDENVSPETSTVDNRPGFLLVDVNHWGFLMVDVDHENISMVEYQTLCSSLWPICAILGIKFVGWRRPAENISLVDGWPRTSIVDVPFYWCFHHAQFFCVAVGYRMIQSQLLIF